MTLRSDSSKHRDMVDPKSMYTQKWLDVIYRPLSYQHVVGKNRALLYRRSFLFMPLAVHKL